MEMSLWLEVETGKHGGQEHLPPFAGYLITASGQLSFAAAAKSSRQPHEEISDDRARQCHEDICQQQKSCGFWLIHAASRGAGNPAQEAISAEVKTAS